MSIQYEVKSTYLLIKLKMEYLDARVAEYVKEEIFSLIEKGSSNLIVIDLSAVEFIDSSGFGALILFLKRCKEVEKSLALCSLTPQARLCFRMLNLDKLFDIRDTLP